MAKSVKMYEELCEMLEDELNSIVKQKDVNQENLDWIDKLTHSIKSIKTTVAMLEAEEGGSYGNSYNSYGYGRSNRNSYDGSYDGSYNSYDYSRNSYDGSYDNSYARRGRDGDGDGRYSERRDGRGRYSRDASKDQMIEKLERMMNDTMDKQDKEAIRNLIQQMRQ